MAAAAAAGAASGLPGPVAQGLKEALVDTLTGILSPVQEVRAAAEEQIKVLEVTEEFGVHLAELTVDPQGALAIRQLASVILKQYVETHWCAQSEKFRPPETTERAKIVIRELLPNGLRESISKVRSSVAYAVSAIAHWDWPEAWPQLFNLLMEMLVSGDLNAVHGAMRVLTGEVLGFENLVFSIFEFVHALLENSKFKSTVKKALPELIYYVILYMQITEEQIKVWTANPQQFVEDEDDDTFSYTVRIAAQDLLLAVATDFQNESAAALAAAATRHLQEAEQTKNSGAEHWWKIHEACMLALGSVKSIITDSVKNGRIHFDMHGFLTNVILADLNLSVSPFLLGRALWAASRFTVAMSPELIQQFLQATVRGLHETQPPSVRISAVRAIWGYCDQLKVSESTHVLQPFLPSILDGLIHLAAQFSSEVLNLVMETLCIVCTVDPEFTASMENKICPFTIAIFLKYSNDPVVASLAQDIFKELSQIEACQGPMQMRLIPTLVSIMQAPADKIPAGLCATAIDILTTVVRNTKPPLSQLLICQAFPAVAQCTLHTDDNATMQNGGECLRAYVSVTLEQVAQWHDEQGHNGLWYVMQVVSQLLDPRTSEFTAAFVGRLVSTLISKAGRELGENLDQILRAILSKMQQAETLSVMQSLIMVFAHLVHTQLEPLLEFLCSLPGPTGKPALEFVMAEWTSRQHLFYGQYEGKVSSVALCKLLQHGINADDKRLQDIRVKGEEIYSVDEGIRTRSKSAKNPERWTNIPLLVKILKLIINELSNVMEANAARQAAPAEWNQDDSNDMWEDQEEEEEEEDGLAGQLLSDILASSKYEEDYYEDDEEDDPDALKDPLYQIDLQAYLTDFLCQFAQQPCYIMFSGHLNDNERRVLQTIGI
ncbi:importin-9 isoform X2 [Elephas maximus indicus]|uniref:importin-9 isoform X2 n=1 Tax=Elephas maximus indicus TaxID=99487 RepID=UPI0021170CA4|nr:importin-9 isoform X2 [Elephas maximus indicus]